MIGALPERRLLLESVYGFLTLKNGVPVGYVLVSALFGSSEIAYNVFETFRGGESGRIYGKVLALTRHLFAPDVFTIFPYQLGGYGNSEALASGAWWFYQKLGFRPRAPHVVALMNEELARMKADPTHRSTLATLKIARFREPLFPSRQGARRRDRPPRAAERGPSGDGHAGPALRLGPRAGRSRAGPGGAQSPRTQVPLRLEREASASLSGAGRRSSRSCLVSRAGPRQKSAPSLRLSGPRAAAASRTSSASSTVTESSGGPWRRSRRARPDLQPGVRFANRATNFLRPARSK